VLTTLAVAFVLFATSSLHPQPSADERAVRRVVEQLAQAFAHNDPSLLDRITTSDYTFVSPTTGEVQNKEQRLVPMRSGALHYTFAQYDEISIRVYGETAVALARVVTRATNAGKDVSGTFRSTIVLTRQHKNWIIVASQASTIPK
jgi:uncharacterized protein (TIGR02246 family)